MVNVRSPFTITHPAPTREECKLDDVSVLTCNLGSPNNRCPGSPSTSLGMVRTRQGGRERGDGRREGADEQREGEREER